MFKRPYRIANKEYSPCLRIFNKQCCICRNTDFIFNMHKLEYALLKNRYVCNDCFLTKTICKSCEMVKSIEETDGNICFECNKNRVIKYFNCLSHKHLSFVNNNKGTLVYEKNPKKGIRYFGIELEYQINHPEYTPYEKHNDDRVARHIRHILAGQVQEIMGKSAIIKHDGSIGFGFEIVSAPATINVHREIWTGFFNDFIINKRLLSSPNCGMHIHINKDSLTLLQMGKVLNFIYAKENRTFIEDISGRSSPYASLNLNKNISDIKKVNNCKYEAVNYRGKNTIEIRTFIAPTSIEEFYKNLEFIDCLIEFSKYISITQCSSKNEFLAFLFENKKQYSHLYSWVHSRVKAILGESASVTLAKGF